MTVDIWPFFFIRLHIYLKHRWKQCQIRIYQNKTGVYPRAINHSIVQSCLDPLVRNKNYSWCTQISVMSSRSFPGDIYFYLLYAHLVHHVIPHLVIADSYIYSYSCCLGMIEQCCSHDVNHKMCDTLKHTYHLQ